MKKLKVIGEYETIREIIKKGASIARFGDGEFKLCRGSKQISQRPSQEISERLCAILKSNDPNLFVGIPNIWGSNKLSDRKEKFWSKYRCQKTTRFLSIKKQYYSAFISRPDAALHIDCTEYWDLCKKMWYDRVVVLVKGEGTGFNKDPMIFAGARSVEVIIAPPRDAFESLEDLFNYLRLYDRGTLFVISLGPTATVLAADLCSAGYQALDLGHFGMMYSKAHHYYKREEKCWND